MYILSLDNQSCCNLLAKCSDTRILTSSYYLQLAPALYHHIIVDLCCCVVVLLVLVIAICTVFIGRERLVVGVALFTSLLVVECGRYYRS